MRTIPATWLILVFDLLFLVAHLWLGQQWSGTLYSFNLDDENNIPTIYQGVKLFSVGFLCWLNAYLLFKAKCKNSWVLGFFGVLGTGATYLAIDELTQIHENASYAIYQEQQHFFTFFIKQGFTGSYSTFHCLH